MFPTFPRFRDLEREHRSLILGLRRDIRRAHVGARTYAPAAPFATLAGGMGELVDAAVARGDVVVSVGGDGMLSSLAGLVSATGGMLGVVPAGRGNDFARMLGLPSAPDEVARLLLEGEVRQVDLIELTLPGGPARLVAGSVYAGVDARAWRTEET